VDGSVLAQLGPTDMRMPIQYALTYPARVATSEVQLDWGKLKRLDFETASTRRFPCLRLAREAMKKGGAWPCALNAADEVAVAAFLEGRLNFLRIAEVIERVLERTAKTKFGSMEDVVAADAEARRVAGEEVGRLGRRGRRFRRDSFYSLTRWACDFGSVGIGVLCEREKDYAESAEDAEGAEKKE